MVCPSCLRIFTTVGPYIDHYPQCTKPPSSKIEKLLDRATVSELALLLWRDAFVAQIAKLPSGEKFSNDIYSSIVSLLHNLILSLLSQCNKRLNCIMNWIHCGWSVLRIKWCIAMIFLIELPSTFSPGSQFCQP